MQHRLAHRVGRSSQATTVAVDKPMSASHTEFLTTPGTWPLGAVNGRSLLPGETTYVDAVITQTSAYARTHQLPFPDGTVLVKMAWKHVQSTEAPAAYVPGAATTVQVMVKDSKKYAATGGWGFGRFINGQPADLAQHQTCWACHQALVKDHDFVFTRLAP